MRRPARRTINDRFVSCKTTPPREPRSTLSTMVPPLSAVRRGAGSAGRQRRRQSNPRPQPHRRRNSRRHRSSGDSQDGRGQVPRFSQGSFPVGRVPYALAFDGSSIWVANNGSGTVSKLTG
jgi:hypothetical protein